MAPKPARPMPRHVYVRRLKPKETKSGIVLPEESKETVFRGKVIMLGPLVDEGEVKRGDVVFFQQALATELDLGARGWAFNVPVKSILLVEEP